MACSGKLVSGSAEVRQAAREVNPRGSSGRQTGQPQKVNTGSRETAVEVEGGDVVDTDL